MKYTVIGIVVVLALVIAFIISILKKKQAQKIIDVIQSNDHKAFEAILEDKLTTFLFPAMYRDSLRLNEAMLRNDPNDIDKILDRLTRARLSEKDKEKIYTQAYNYYLSTKSYKKCTIWYEKIQTLKNDRLVNEISKSYDIYVTKGYKYLDEMLEELEDIEPSNRGVNEFLISLMYKNKGDKENALKYEKLSQEHLAEYDKAHENTEA